LYFYDWTLVSVGAKRLENMAAISLLRMVCRWNELGLGDFDLRYVRNQQGKEIVCFQTRCFTAGRKRNV